MGQKDIAFLEPKVIEIFQSDFLYLAECVRYKRLKKDYRPSRNILTHADAVVKMLTAMTGDRKFEDAFYEIKTKKEGMVLAYSN